MNCILPFCNRKATKKYNLMNLCEEHYNNILERMKQREQETKRFRKLHNTPTFVRLASDKGRKNNHNEKGGNVI